MPFLRRLHVQAEDTVSVKADSKGGIMWWVQTKVGGVSLRSLLRFLLVSSGVFVFASYWLPNVSAQSVTSPTITKIVAGGDPTPIGGVFANDGTPALGLGESRPSDDGGTVFYASVIGGTVPTAIFRITGNTISKVVAVGDKAPTGGKFSFLFPPSHNSLGDVGFGALIEGGTAPQGLFLFSGGQLATIATLPGTIPLADLVPSSPVLNAKGDVLFKAPMKAGQNGLGIYRGLGKQITKVVETGDVGPVGNQSNLELRDYTSVVENDAGEVVFATPRGIFGATRTGELSKVVAVGDSSPTGGTFQSFDMPTFNNHGAIAFAASATGPGGGLNRSIFLVSGGQTVRIVGEGDLTPVGGAFSIVGPPVLNDRGEIVFVALLSRLPPVGGLFSAPAGVFLYSGGGIHKIVATGDPTPIGGKFLSGVGPATLSNAGIIQFPGVIDTDGDGNPNNQGIFSVEFSGR